MDNLCKGYNPDYSEDAPSLEQISGQPGDLLLEFGAPWCMHCQAGARAVQAAMADYPQLPHLKLYDGKGKPLGRAFKVKLWPTLILLKDGQEVARRVRPVMAEEVRELLAQLACRGQ